MLFPAKISYGITDSCEIDGAAVIIHTVGYKVIAVVWVGKHGYDTVPREDEE